MRFLVTGGAGFIGSHLVEELLRNSHSLMIVDDLSTGFIENLPKEGEFQFLQNKIQDIENDLIGNIDGIFHLAAQASVPVSISHFYSSSVNNLQSTLKVFEIAKTKMIPVVYASSSAIYGNLPLGDDSVNNFNILSPYALDKLTMEQYAYLCYKLFRVGSLGLRFFNVYGPRQDPRSPYSGVISIFLDKFIRKECIVINGGYQTRDFVYVRDIAKTAVKAMETLQTEENKCLVVNVGTGVSVSIDSVFNKFVDLFRYTPNKIYKELDKSDPERSEGKFFNLRTKLKIKNKTFTTFSDGLNETVKYYLNSTKQ